FDHRVLRPCTRDHRWTRAPYQPLSHRRLSSRPPLSGGPPPPPPPPPAPACGVVLRSGRSPRAARIPVPTAGSCTRWATAPTDPLLSPPRPVGHVLSLVLLAVDCLTRAWRIQLAIWTAGGRLSFKHAFRLNLYGEAASQLTPNRLGGEPARFLGLNEARFRPVTGLVAIGVEVAAEWPVFLIVAAALFAYYVP